ncbi:MAG: chromate transporter [Defluviitaleaceae bacterium]|nr:chromate transporter [Defluviitaleaceae bacterium]
MIYLQIFWVFFITNMLGYGGGPATIPLVQHEVVEVFGWLTEAEFAEVLAMGNALPGPIATKMAGYIGFMQGGVLGAVIALAATIMPSIILMLALMGVLMRYRESPQVKRLTIYVRPTVAVLLGAIALQLFFSGWQSIGWLHMVILIAASYACLEKFKVHPALVVLATLVYGAMLLG